MIIKRDDLVTEISNKLDLHKYSVKEVINCLEEVINGDLIKANKNEDIEIRLFNGLKLKSTYIPSHIGKNPKTNEDVIVDDKIKVIAKVTDYYNNKLNKCN